MARRRVDPSRTCNRPGPMVKTSPQYVAQVNCNRSHGHPLPHRHYDRNTFRVVAEWTNADQYEPFQPKKKVGLELKADRKAKA